MDTSTGTARPTGTPPPAPRLSAAETTRERRDGHGENHPCTKVTTANVEAMRRSSASNSELAREYGLARESVRDIRRGKNWRHIPMPEGVK
jgi:hypothetical protein